MKIDRPTETRAILQSASNDAVKVQQQGERKLRPPKLTIELSDEEVETIAIYVAEHRSTQRAVIRWLIQLLPELPGGPPLRSQSRPERMERKSRGG